ncbi:MAG: hypothetical protein H0V18_06690 [Pyrinomonadaceae bacterium]|nr:hypothetical protein [Pyrinomonadaceae bacterium]
MEASFISALLVLLLAGVHVVRAADSGTRLVPNKSDNTISLIDLPSKKVVATIPTGVGPHEVAVLPDGASIDAAKRSPKSHEVTRIEASISCGFV